MTRSVYLPILAVLTAASIDAAPLQSQQVARVTADTESRAREIAAAFNKSKREVKERRGIRVEKYKEVKSVPLVRANPESLSGTYEVDDFGFVLRLRIDRNGRVTGSGQEQIAEGVMRTFTLADAQLRGALLTGTKVFASGRSQRIEGVFLTRTSYDSPSDRGYTQVGIGVIGDPVQLHGVTLDKRFYRFKSDGLASASGS